MLLTHQPIKKISLHKEEERSLQFFEKGERIPLFNLGLWQVYQGVVQLSTINPNAEEVILGWGIPDTCFGSWLSDLSAYQAQALSDVSLRWFSRSEIESSPNLHRAILGQISQRLTKTEALLAITGMRRVEERLWQLLLFLKQEMGESVAGGTRIAVRFTHQNLANVICTTRVTVTRVLGDFQQRGLISFDGDRHIVICDSFSRSN